MAETPPSYYTRLPPFAALFATGVPMLMYHKLGPRPRGVRLKGLYVGCGLFARQLAELRAAGFVTPPLAAPPGEAGNPGRRLALTFDDGFANVLRHGLEPLARHGFRAIEYLVAGRLGATNDWEERDGECREQLMDAAQVRDWLAAGHEIGAHTLTHPRLTQIPPAQAREEIAGSRHRLEDEFGVPVRHFCYPYGDWNEAVRDWVGEAGYATACTTVAGVNPAGTHPLALRRHLARHRSLRLRDWQAAWKRWWACRPGGGS